MAKNDKKKEQNTSTPEEKKMDTQIIPQEKNNDNTSLVLKENMPSSKELKGMLKEETAKRKLINQYIQENLINGTDYGKIHIAKNCQNPYGCGTASHWSNDTLFKPGAEKICSLLNLRAEFIIDQEMKGILPQGHIPFICYLFSKSGGIVGEGRGSSSIAEKGNANTAIKIAEKRAKVDAVLSIAALSGRFTQDLEEEEMDLDKKEDVKKEISEPKKTKKKDTNKKGSSHFHKEAKKLWDLYCEKIGEKRKEGVLKATLKKYYNKETIEELLDKEADDFGIEIDRQIKYLKEKDIKKKV